MKMEEAIADRIGEVVEQQRMARYNISNLDSIMEQVHADVRLSTYRLGENEAESISTSFSFALGVAMTFILYMFLLIYGRMVMDGIIEEKNSRVLDLMVTSVKPTDLMLGKILGIGLVAVVQVAIWAALMCSFAAFVLPWLMPAGLMDPAMEAQASESPLSPEMMQTFAKVTSPGYIAMMFVYILVFLVGGFLFYASIFAAIGSAVDNQQDSSQLQTFAVLPILAAMLIAFSVSADPNSGLAVWGSMVPFTSPMVMLARIPFGIDSWQIWLSAAILFVSFVGMAVIAGKIYRVGIFMHGKKPTMKDLYFWIRYK